MSRSLCSLITKERTLSSLQPLEFISIFQTFRHCCCCCQRGLWEFDATSCSCLDQRPEGPKENKSGGSNEICIYIENKINKFDDTFLKIKLYTNIEYN